MGRRMGEDKRSTSSSKHHTLKEATPVNDERTRRVEQTRATDTSSFNANAAELPLFFPTPSTRRHDATKSASLNVTNPHLSSKAGHGRNDLNADVKIKHGEAAGWPLGSQDIAAWASTFRFEFDKQDGERLQAMLQQNPHCEETNTGKRNNDTRTFTGTPSGSFRFMKNGTEELMSGNQFGYLKPPRQLEKIHGSNRFTAVLPNACATVQKQQCDAQSKDVLSLLQVEARSCFVVTVPPSPRVEILRRLSDLKAHPASPRFAPEDAVRYHKEKAKMAAMRHDHHQRLKMGLPLLPNDSSKGSPTSGRSPHQYKAKTQENALGEPKMTPVTFGEIRRQSNSSSGLRGSPRKYAQFSQEHPTTPTSRFKDGFIQEQIVSIRKQPHSSRASIVSNYSPDHNPSVPAAIPFKWEEEPGKPKTIAADANRTVARRLPREGIEVSNCIETQFVSLKVDEKPSTGAIEHDNVGKGIAQARVSSARISTDNGNGDVGRTGSHRYYGKASFRELTRDLSLGRSSRRYSTQERKSHIDLDGTAAAKFLVETYESPSRTPSVHGSSPAFAVPFKWEDAPGKAKAEMVARRPNMLQLPPRLAVPSYHSAQSFSRELRASHPFAGFFTPCLQASSPVHRKQSDRALVQSFSSRSLPPRAPSSPERRKRHSFVGRCSSTPQEGCQIRVSKSFIEKSSSERTPSHCSSDKALIESFSSISSPVLKPKTLYSSEVRSSSSWMQKRNPNAPSSPTSTLCGPDESSSQTSASNIMFSSGDLEAFSLQTSCAQSASKLSSKSGSSASYGSIQEEFAELPSPSHSVPRPPDPQHFGEYQGVPNPALDPIALDFTGKEHHSHRSKGTPDGVNSLKLSRTGKFLAKTGSQQRLDTTLSPEVTLINYFQSLELAQTATTTSASVSVSASTEETGLLDKQGAPTSSGYLNSEGEPLALTAFPTMQSVAKQEENASAKDSPKRPTRLPYTMPTAAEQFLASCSNSGRRQLIQDLSPRIVRQFSGRRLSASHNSGSNTPTRGSGAQAGHGEEVSQSPAFVASLELFSPAGNLMAQRWKGSGTPRTPIPPPKPRRRTRFMLSICKSLRRALYRQQRRKPIEPPKLLLREGQSPRPFQFKTAYV